MGGGDLNLKKSWHPLTYRNQEKVWKREQRVIEEDKKLAILLQEKKEEQEKEALQTLHRGSSSVQKLEWMYTGGRGVGGGLGASAASISDEREEYLLGRRRIDAAVLDSAHSEATAASTVDSTSIATGLAFGAKTIYGMMANTAKDMGNKIRDDPMLEIKRREQASMNAILSNPVHLARLKAAAKASKNEGAGSVSTRPQSSRSRDDEDTSSRRKSSSERKRSRSPMQYEHHRISSSRRDRHHSRSPSPPSIRRREYRDSSERASEHRDSSRHRYDRRPSHDKAYSRDHHRGRIESDTSSRYRYDSRERYGHSSSTLSTDHHRLRDEERLSHHRNESRYRTDERHSSQRRSLTPPRRRDRDSVRGVDHDRHGPSSSRISPSSNPSIPSIRSDHVDEVAHHSHPNEPSFEQSSKSRPQPQLDDRLAEMQRNAQDLAHIRQTRISHLDEREAAEEKFDAESRAKRATQAGGDGLSFSRDLHHSIYQKSGATVSDMIIRNKAFSRSE